MEFNKGKCKVLCSGRKNHMHRYKIRNNWSESSTSEKDLGITVDHKPNTSQQKDALLKMAIIILACREVPDVRQGRELSHSSQHLASHQLDECVQLWVLYFKKDRDKFES